MNVYHENQVPWPADRALTTARKNGPFRTSLADACKRVECAVSAFTKAGSASRTNELWIFADGELGAMGRFLANQRGLCDARVAVRFDLDGIEYNIVADRYIEPWQNLAGIAEYIKAIRAQERNGIFTASEMFVAFAALPGSRDWFAGCSGAEQVKSRYRTLAAEHHPDRGGDTAVMAEINAQYAAARGEAV